NGSAYLIAQIQDITERKSLEEKVQRGQKLESIGQLAAGIAHEINTPTQYVGDNVRFLKDSFEDFMSVFEKTAQMVELCKSQNILTEFVPEIEGVIERADVQYLSEEVPKAFDQALDGVERIRKIVQSMKDFAHPGTTTMQFTDLNKAIESTLTVASNEWKYIADVVTNYDETLPLIPCLAGEFNQVILNMIVNAAHAISDTIGEGSNEKGSINITTTKNGDFAEIRICDSGGGIPEDIRKKIFDPFFTTKVVGKGTGQGLAISHTVIVEKHKGTISVESEMGKGTTFVICLPVSETAAAG
ncbi:MAG: ATP-binding protein, partial [Acidobacteriota bacterium]